jgi:adenine/guanine/hypoxanthine permease
MSTEIPETAAPEEPVPTSAVDRFFHLTENKTTVRTEVIAGVTTFLAMAYIIFVNPMILGETGMDTGAIFVATCVAAALGTAIMGLWARYPIAQAPGMGLNAFFAFTVVLGLGIPWEVALAGTFASGFLFLMLAITGVREMIVNAIPMHMKLAVGAGIGLFIAFIGLKNAGIVVMDEATAVSMGNLTRGPTVLAIFGLLVTAIMLIRGLKGAVFYGIVVTAVVGIVFNQVAMPDAIVGRIPSVAPTFGEALVNIPELFTAQMLIVVLTMLFVDLFDTTGTLIAVANQAGFLDSEGRLPRANRALISDAAATMAGATLGTSTTTSYIESAAGVGAGGRTGLTSVVTSGLFVLALPFSPLLAVVTAEVTAAALIIVGVMMAKGLGQIEWGKMEYAIPAFVTVVGMPLTYSIANGIAMGLFTHTLLMAVKGRYREIHPIMYGLAVIFLAYFIWFAE